MREATTFEQKPERPESLFIYSRNVWVPVLCWGTMEGGLGQVSPKAASKVGFLCMWFSEEICKRVRKAGKRRVQAKMGFHKSSLSIISRGTLEHHRICPMLGLGATFWYPPTTQGGEMGSNFSGISRQVSSCRVKQTSRKGTGRSH